MSTETQITEIYYDNEPFLEDDLPESQPQIDLSDYGRDVLKYKYATEGESGFVTGNLAIFPPNNTYPFRYLAPDIAVFNRVVLNEAEQKNLSSWRMEKANRPAPTVVFEISSKETWTQDLDPKPTHYGLLGVREYFAYDPIHLWQGATTQLRGWRYSNGLAQEIPPDQRGWLWSIELDSWVVPDDVYFRLYDRQGNRRLTAEEAYYQRAEIERAAREVEFQRAETERAAREVEFQRAETERAAKEAAILREQAILEKLRKANIDLDSL